MWALPGSRAAGPIVLGRRVRPDDSPAKVRRGVLLLVENLSVPFDRRVWLEALTLRDAGYMVSVISPTGIGRDNERFVELEGVAIYRYALPPTASNMLSYLREYSVALRQSLRLALRAYRERGFQVIHGCCPPDLFFLIALVFRPLGVRYVFDHHDLSPELFRAVFGNRHTRLYRLLLACERLSFRTAHTIVTTNESLREIAIRRGGARPEQIFVVRTGPDLNRLHAVPESGHPARTHTYLVAYLGVMGVQDGVELALQAADRIVHRAGRTDIGFVFIGSGDQFDRLRGVAQTLRLESNVTFTGRISDPELLGHLSASDVCICPDPQNGVNELHTMNKTLEYMAMGKPIVAFDLKETRVSAGDAAVYAQPNEVDDFAAKLLALIDDPARRQAMGRSGQLRVRNALGWEYSRLVLLDAYAHAFAGLERHTAGQSI